MASALFAREFETNALGASSITMSRREIQGFYWEIVPLTFGRARIIYTDGIFIEDGY